MGRNQFSSGRNDKLAEPTQEPVKCGILFASRIPVTALRCSARSQRHSRVCLYTQPHGGDAGDNDNTVPGAAVRRERATRETLSELRLGEQH